ncbi:unnamed protein product [Brassica rapa subsp. narinosa]
MGGTVRRGSLMFGYVIPAPVLNLLVHNGGLIHSLVVGGTSQWAQLELFAVRRWHQSFGAALAGKPISIAVWSHISSKVSSPFGKAFIWSTSSFCYAF